MSRGPAPESRPAAAIFEQPQPIAAQRVPETQIVAELAQVVLHLAESGSPEALRRAASIHIPATMRPERPLLKHCHTPRAQWRPCDAPGIASDLRSADRAAKAASLGCRLRRQAMSRAGAASPSGPLDAAAWPTRARAAPRETSRA